MLFLENGFSRRNLDFEGAVFRGCDAFGRTIDQNGYTHERLLIGVEDFSRHLPVLGRKGCYSPSQYQKKG